MPEREEADVFHACNLCHSRQFASATVRGPPWERLFHAVAKGMPNPRRTTADVAPRR